MEFNRYVYAAGNPVRWDDPTGYTLFETLSNYVGTIKNTAWGHLAHGFRDGAIAGAAGYLLGIGIYSLIEYGISEDPNANLGQIIQDNFLPADFLSAILWGGWLGTANSVSQILSNKYFADVVKNKYKNMVVSTADMRLVANILGYTIGGLLTGILQEVSNRLITRTYVDIYDVVVAAGLGLSNILSISGDIIKGKLGILVTIASNSAAIVYFRDRDIIPEKCTIIRCET